jgi:hypothetical protein
MILLGSELLSKAIQLYREFSVDTNIFRTVVNLYKVWKKLEKPKSGEQNCLKQKL